MVDGVAVISDHGALLHAEGEITGLLDGVDLAVAFQDCFRIQRERGAAFDPLPTKNRSKRENCTS